MGDSLNNFFFKYFPSVFFPFDFFFSEFFFLQIFFLVKGDFSVSRSLYIKELFCHIIFFLPKNLCWTNFFCRNFFCRRETFSPVKEFFFQRTFFPENFFPLKKIFSKRNISPFELKKLKQVSNNRNVYQTNQRKWKHQKEEKKNIMQCIWWNLILMADSYKQKSLGSVYFF